MRWSTRSSGTRCSSTNSKSAASGEGHQARRLMARAVVWLAGGWTALLGIDTVAVVVSDRRRALAWFRDVLGLEVAYVPPEVGHWIEMGPKRPRTRLHLCEMGGAAEPGPTGITLVTDDMQADFRRLRGRGVRSLSEPKLEEWG